MTHAALAEELWSDDPPKFPLPTLQVVVSRLRGRLEQYGNRIVAEPGGYRLEVGPEETDLLTAEALLRDGRNALGQGRGVAAASAFEHTLLLWARMPSRVLPDSPSPRARLGGCAKLRLSLVEARNDTYLFGGRHLETLADIDAYIAEEPLREHLRAQQVATLYRAGRQAEALPASTRCARRCETARPRVSPAIARRTPGTGSGSEPAAGPPRA